MIASTQKFHEKNNIIVELLSKSCVTPFTYTCSIVEGLLAQKESIIKRILFSLNHHVTMTAYKDVHVTHE